MPEDNAKQNRICIGTSDDERYRALKDRVITVPSFDESSMARIDTNDYTSLERIGKSGAFKILRRIGEEFGVFKDDYTVQDVDVEFSFSKRNLQESIHKHTRRGKFRNYAQMLTVFNEVIESAIGIEAHNERYYNPGSKLDKIYVFTSAYYNNEYIVPVLLEVKTYTDTTLPILYIALSLREIKRSRILGHIPDTKGIKSYPSPTSINVNLTDLLSYVNIKDKNLLKYIPDGFLDDIQREAKQLALKEAADYIEKKNKQRFADDSSNASGDSSVSEAISEYIDDESTIVFVFRKKSGQPVFPERFYLWGAGSIGKRALAYLAPLGIINGIIDSDSAKEGTALCGLPVFTYESVTHKLNESGIVIAHFSPEETEEILVKDGISHWRLSDFITLWFRQSRQKNAVGFLDFPITTRCTLNCTKCMQYIPHRSKQDIPLGELKHDLSALFQAVDFIGEISIIGGEPFLHERLPELIDYINGNFREQIGSLVITTNGTVIPGARVLEACHVAGVHVSISDYSASLAHLDKYPDEFEETVNSAGVKTERKRWVWHDPGQFDGDGDGSGYTDCTVSHMQLLDGKLWRCTLMAAGCAAGFCDAVRGVDYIDLTEDHNDLLAQNFLSASLRERTSQCRNCLYPHKIPISSAEQMPAGAALNNEL